MASNTALEYTLPGPPQDPVSSLTFNPNPANSNQLLVASWDKTVRLFHLPTSDDESALTSSDTAASHVRLVHTFTHEAAVLDVCWITDTLAASASLDRRVRMLNLRTGQTNIIGKHSAAVSRVRYSAATNLLLSCSWDATIKVWDPSPDAASLLHTITLPDKALAMDLSPPFPASSPNIIDATPRAVVGMAGRLVHIFDLTRWRYAVDRKDTDEMAWKPEQKRESSLKYMLRDIRCMPSGDGYATSSVEGRIAVEFFDTSDEAQAKKYAFKCHRQVVDGVDTVYPVNAMAFHPIHATFASLGGDAIMAVWDPLAKKRIRQYPRLPSPLSAGVISPDGKLIAVASGFENIEETRHAGPAPGEVGGIGAGGEGKVQIHIRTNALDECKPKSR